MERGPERSSSHFTFHLYVRMHAVGKSKISCERYKEGEKSRRETFDKIPIYLGITFTVDNLVGNPPRDKWFPSTVCDRGWHGDALAFVW